MKNDEVKGVRNIAILSHGAAGKTSLADAMVYAGGAVDIMGSVDNGTSVFMHEPEEMSRKITITSSLGFADWKGVRINIIDTPGYINFLEETKGTLRAADGAIVIVSALSGVKAETEKIYKFACDYEISRIAFISKLDKERADFFRAVGDMEKYFCKGALVLQLPIGLEENFSGVVDLIKMKALYFAKDGSGKAEEKEIPDSMKADAAAYRKKLVEQIAETEDSLLEKYLDKGDLSQEDLIAGLKHGTLVGGLLPVLCGSPVKNMGIRQLMDAVVTCLPSPAERAGIVAVKGKDLKTGQEIARKPAHDEPLAALVFKTVIDPFAGKLSMVRVFSGTLKSDSTGYNSTRQTREKIGTLFLVEGKKQVSVSALSAGQIGAVAKLKETQTGDTLCAEHQPIVMDFAKFADPVMSYAVTPKSRGDEDKVSIGIHKLLEEDPTLKFTYDEQTKEMVLSGMGQVHLEVTLEKLKRKFGVDVTMKTPKVPYKETIRAKASAQGKYKKQTGGHGQYGDAWLEIEPLPRGSGFEFVDNIVGGVVPRQYIPAVEKGVVEAMHEGIIAGYPVVDIRVSLYDGSYHAVDSSEMAFKVAASMAFKKAVEAAKPVLLEPIMSVEVVAPDDTLGAVIGDLNSRRGKVQGVVPQANGQAIKALVPMSEMLTYAPTLNSLTSGRAMYTMEFYSYEDVPSHLAQKITQERAAQLHGGAAHNQKEK
ncbi:MAG TPA: elongation factor G [Nitrospirota bacterium]|nr:elongation factor G [Nitrospirota bacterium]